MTKTDLQELFLSSVLNEFWHHVPQEIYGNAFARWNFVGYPQASKLSHEEKDAEAWCIVAEFQRMNHEPFS
jgi:hypothetical protein